MATTGNETIAPHGGTLVNLLMDAAEAERATEQAEHLPKLSVGTRELSDLEMLAVGALSPLSGFVGQKDYWSVIDEMHLSNGLPWTIPVTLSLSEEEAKRIGGASSVALTDDRGAIAVLDVEEVYRRDREREAESVFRTTDLEHPGV
jgi:sulfate adenylyltransferase